MPADSTCSVALIDAISVAPGLPRSSPAARRSVGERIDVARQCARSERAQSRRPFGTVSGRITGTESALPKRRGEPTAAAFAADDDGLDRGLRVDEGAMAMTHALAKCAMSSEFSWRAASLPMIRGSRAAFGEQRRGSRLNTYGAQSRRGVSMTAGCAATNAGHAARSVPM